MTTATVIPAAVLAPPAERFVCQECGCGVTIERMTRGAAFAIISVQGAPDDTSFGIGASGDPLCPEGHGGMLPDPVDGEADPGEVPPLSQAELFDLAQPFNFEGAYLELERLTVTVDEFARIAEADKKQAAAARKTWEDAATRLHKATLELRRRRLAKLRQPAPEEAPPEAPED